MPDMIRGVREAAAKMEAEYMASTGHYLMEVRLEPATGKVTADARMDWYAAGSDTGEIVFALHRSARIDRLTGDRAFRYELRPEGPVPYAPEAATLSVRTGGPLESGRHLRLELGYQLKLGVLEPWEVNRVTPEWVSWGCTSPGFHLT